MSSIVEHRVVAVPRIGDGFIAVLSDLVEVLIALEGDSRSEGGLALPTALTDGSALGALDRLASVLIPTQTARSPRLFGREGREYPSIVFVEIHATDLQLLGVVVQAIGMAHLRDERRVGSAWQRSCRCHGRGPPRQPTSSQVLPACMACSTSRGPRTPRSCSPRCRELRQPALRSP